MPRLTNHTMAIFLADGDEDLEYYVPLMRLQEEGATVLSVAMDLKPVRGKNGLEVAPDTLAANVGPAALLGLVVPGGWAPDKLRRYQPILDLVRAIDAAGKPLGIICHGGLVPISAGILRGHRATGSLG